MNWEERVLIQPATASTSDVNSERETLIIVYTSLLILTLIVFIARTYGFFAMCLRISLRLHDRLFRGITSTSMYFFNTNSSGRILNRFSKDIRVVDNDVPHTLIDCLSVCNIKWNLLSTIIYNVCNGSVNDRDSK